MGNHIKEEEEEDQIFNFIFFRTLSEFWHWFVANVPGDSVDDGEVIFDLLFPLVLPEGDGDHRSDKTLNETGQLIFF